MVNHPPSHSLLPTPSLEVSSLGESPGTLWALQGQEINPRWLSQKDFSIVYYTVTQPNSTSTVLPESEQEAGVSSTWRFLENGK